MTIPIDFIKQKISNIYAEKLISLYSYQQALSDDDEQGELYLLLIVTGYTKSDLEDHQSFQKELKNKYFRKQPVSTKLFTKNELLNSLDVFPIEFLDIKTKSILLSGEDILNGLSIDQKNLRHECEFYLRTHMLKLREGFIQPSANAGQLIRGSLPFLISIFKNLLQLKGKDVPDCSGNVILALSNEIKFESEVFYSILNEKNPKELGQYFERYLIAIAQITSQVDQFHAEK